MGNAQIVAPLLSQASVRRLLLIVHAEANRVLSHYGTVFCVAFGYGVISVDVCWEEGTCTALGGTFIVESKDFPLTGDVIRMLFSTQT